MQTYKEKKDKLSYIQAKSKNQSKKGKGGPGSPGASNLSETQQLNSSTSGRTWTNPLIMFSSTKELSNTGMDSPRVGSGTITVDIPEEKVNQDGVKSGTPKSSRGRKRYDKHGFLARAPARVAAKLEALSMKKHDQYGESIKKFWLSWFKFLKKPWTLQKTFILLLGAPLLLSLPFLLMPFLGLGVTIMIVVLAILFVVQMIIPTLISFVSIFILLSFAFSVYAASKRSIWVAISTINNAQVNGYVRTDYDYYRQFFDPWYVPISAGKAAIYLCAPAVFVYALLCDLNEWHVKECAKGVKFKDAQKLMNDKTLQVLGYVNYSEKELLKRVKAREKAMNPSPKVSSPRSSFRFSLRGGLPDLTVKIPTPTSGMSTPTSTGSPRSDFNPLSPRGSNELKRLKGRLIYHPLSRDY